jgi:hypothetical protein
MPAQSRKVTPPRSRASCGPCRRITHRSSSRSCGADKDVDLPADLDDWRPTGADADAQTRWFPEGLGWLLPWEVRTRHGQVL